MDEERQKQSERQPVRDFAGVLCRPSPRGRKEKAITKRVKLVTMMSSPGAIDNTVSSATYWMIFARDAGVARRDKVIEVRQLGRCGRRQKQAA